MSKKLIVDVLRQYSLVLTVYATVTLYFLFTNFGVLLLALRTIASGNTLVQIAKSQHFFIGAIVGIVAMIILYVAHGSGHKEKIKITLLHGCMLLALLLWSTVLIDSVYISARVENIIHWSKALMRADKTIFRVYPAFFMFSHYNFIFERTIILSYMYVPLLVGVWTGFLFVTQKIGELKKWLVSGFLALGLCIPIWIAVPAMEPLTSYVVNVFRQEIPEDIANEIKKGPPSPYLLKQTTMYQNFWLDNQGLRHAVSNFPSMHTIWGFLLLFSTYRVFKSKKLSVVLFIVAVANMTGAVYLLQHFAVDLLASFCVLVVITLTQRTKKTI
ncbi:MAG: phosphatase PAP2 family protein [Candidatus Pacebacteria bacterium]|jgi:membrane-associated phospholipid phosphatase|nr:phosphatase PAP2 family protein [Candidatus Paceibacterota bacterium]